MATYILHIIELELRFNCLSKELVIFNMSHQMLESVVIPLVLRQIKNANVLMNQGSVINSILIVCFDQSHNFLVKSLLRLEKFWCYFLINLILSSVLIVKRLLCCVFFVHRFNSYEIVGLINGFLSVFRIWTILYVCWDEIYAWVLLLHFYWPI